MSLPNLGRRVVGNRSVDSGHPALRVEPLLRRPPRRCRHVLTGIRRLLRGRRVDSDLTLSPAAALGRAPFRFEGGDRTRRSHSRSRRQPPPRGRGNTSTADTAPEGTANFLVPASVAHRLTPRSQLSRPRPAPLSAICRLGPLHRQPPCGTHCPEAISPKAVRRGASSRYRPQYPAVRRIADVHSAWLDSRLRSEAPGAVYADATWKDQAQ